MKSSGRLRSLFSHDWGKRSNLARLISLLGSLALGLIAALLYRVFWDLLGPFPAANTVLLLFDVVLTSLLLVGSFLLILFAADGSRVSSSKAKIFCLSLLLSAVFFLLFFFSGFILYTFATSGLWSTVGQAYRSFLQTFSFPIPSQEPQLFTVTIEFNIYWLIFQLGAPILFLYLYYSMLRDSELQKTRIQNLLNSSLGRTEPYYKPLDTSPVRKALSRERLVTRIVLFLSLGCALLSVCVGLFLKWDFELIGVTVACVIIIGIFAVDMFLMRLFGAFLRSHARSISRKAKGDSIFGEFTGGLQVSKGVSKGRWYITDSSLIFEGELKSYLLPDDTSFPLSQLQSLEVKQRDYGEAPQFRSGENKMHILSIWLIATFNIGSETNQTVIYLNHPRYTLSKFLSTIQLACNKCGKQVPTTTS